MTPHCGHMYGPGEKCQGLRTDHVHLPLPCDNGADYRHHDFVQDVVQLRRHYPDLLADIQVMAPALTRRERIELRKALLT